MDMTQPPQDLRPFQAGELRRHLDMYVLSETCLVLGREALQQALLDLASHGALGRTLDALLAQDLPVRTADIHSLKEDAASMGLLSVVRAAAMLETHAQDERNLATAAARHALYENLLGTWRISHELLHALGFMPEPDAFHRQMDLQGRVPQFPLRVIGSATPPADGTIARHLVQLTYLSEQIPELGLNLLDLLEVAGRVNPALDITGMLLVSGTHFFQLLEGPAEAVYGLYDRIRQDPRHTRVMTVSIESIATRSLPHWSMAVCEVRSQGGSYTLSNALFNGQGAHLEDLVLPGSGRQQLKRFCEGGMAA